MAMCSLLSVFRSKKLWPQSLTGFGSFAARFSAAGENWVGETALFTNGARRAIVRPPWHAGDVKAAKFPASIAGVGTNWKKLVGVTLTPRALVPPEVEELPLQDWPAERSTELIPMESIAPALAVRPDSMAANALVAFSESSRMTSKPLPCRALVLDLISLDSPSMAVILHRSHAMDQSG